jgi:hypothetical protein
MDSLAKVARYRQEAQRCRRLANACDGVLARDRWLRLEGIYLDQARQAEAVGRSTGDDTPAETVARERRPPAS